MGFIKEKYLQFPLCLLGLPIDIPGLDEDKKNLIRLNRILDYGIVELVSKLERIEPETEKYREMRVGYPNPEEQVKDIPEACLPEGFDRNMREHLHHVIIQTQFFHISGGSIPQAYKAWEQCSQYIAQHKRAGGKVVSCRMRGDIIHDAYFGMMTWREFSVLAAVYSIIGNKREPVLIRRSLIQARQTGCESVGMMRAKGIEPLSINQIRYTLDKLEGAGWFSRIDFNRKSTYFSLAVGREANFRHLDKKLFANAKAKERRKRDRKYFAETREMIPDILGDFLSKNTGKNRKIPELKEY